MLKLQRAGASFATVFMALVAYYDANTSNQISLWFLYIGPVALVSSRFDFLSGAFAACMAGALLLVAAIFSGHPYENNQFFLFATLCQVLTFILIAWYSSRLAAVQSVLKKLLSIAD